MGQANSSGRLGQPEDLTVFPHLKAASPGGVHYIGKVEILDVTGGTVFNIVTHGGVAEAMVVAVGQIIDGPIRDIAAGTNITRCRIWYFDSL